MGFVGLSLAVVLASKGVHVIGIEHEKQKLEPLKKGKSTFYEPDLEKMLQESLQNKKLEFFASIEEVFVAVDLIFVTVGTPTTDGTINLSAMKSAISSLGKLLSKSSQFPLIVIKSTIAPGTTERIILPLLEKFSKKKLGHGFFLATNPEFLREGSAIFDQLHPHAIVIGSADKKSEEILMNFYKKTYPSDIARISVNFPTSEMIKYANNAFLATKISFINTISNLCQKIPNTNVDVVAKSIGRDPRIGSEFLKAGAGYGGSCLPKDLDSFISVYKEYGLNPILFESVKKVNSFQIREIISLMKQKMHKLKGKSISILGLAFKENSDDIRESTSIKLVRKLLQEKCKIKVHDPMAIPNAKRIFKNKIFYFDSIEDCLENSDCVIIMTPWAQYTKLNSKNFKKMRNSLIIDTRRILTNSDINADYVALGISNDRESSK